MIAESILCLALNLYHEARGEGPEGMAAVATVTLNRVAHPDWPDTICEVVRQPAQFSWTLGGDPPITEPNAWAYAKAVATDVLLDEYPAMLDHRALHFHTQSVAPGWASRMERLGQIGDHIFYGPPTHPPSTRPTRPKPRPETLK